MKVRVVAPFQTSEHDEAGELVVTHREVGDELDLEEHRAIEEIHRNRVVSLEVAPEPELATEEPAAQSGAESEGELGESDAAE